MSDTPNPDSLAESIAARLQRTLGRTSGADMDGDDYDEPRRGRVPYDRFAAKSREVRDLRAELEAMQGKMTELQQGYQASLDALKAEAAEQVKEIGQRHGQDLELVDLGLRDPLGRKALRDAWEAQPKDARGKSPVEWWRSSLDAHKAHHADPEQATAPEIPRVLSGYLPALEAASDKPAGRSGSPPSAPTPRQAGSLQDIKPDVGLQGLLGALREGTG